MKINFFIYKLLLIIESVLNKGLEDFEVKFLHTKMNDQNEEEIQIL